MLVKFEITPDHVCMEDKINIPRPLHISRARWCAFWRWLALGGITTAKMGYVRKFLTEARNASKSFDY